jgi:inhibitor of KinA sporulation pathway (predicted exonuclease)
VKSNFARQHGLRRKVGLAGALRVLGVPLEGVHHRGGDDAWNIALLLAHLLRTHDASELVSADEESGKPAGGDPTKESDRRGTNPSTR